MTTLVVEDGSIVDGANSYFTPEGFDEYWAGSNYAETTRDAVYPDKVRAAIEVTRYMDGVYGHRLRGALRERTQPRQLPRVWDGWMYRSDEIPQPWIEAGYELMAKVLAGTALYPDSSDSGSLESKDLTVGPIKIKKKWQGGASSQATKFSFAESILRPLLYQPGLMRRG